MKSLIAFFRMIGSIFGWAGNDERQKRKTVETEIREPALVADAERDAEKIKDVGEKRDERREGKKKYGWRWRKFKREDRRDNFKDEKKRRDERD